MSGEDESKKKSFTFIWKLENVSYCWQKQGELVRSPPFMIDVIEKTKWNLTFRVRNGCHMIGFLLERTEDSVRVESGEICYELAFLAEDGTVLKSFKRPIPVKINSYGGSPSFMSRNEMFVERRSEFLPHDTLTARCRVWKSMGENVQCFACTRINVEKQSYMWNIKNFSTLQWNEKQTYDIKSLDASEQLMHLEFFVTGGQITEETVYFAISPNHQIMKMGSFQLFVVDASKNLVECFHDEFWVGDPYGRREFPLFLKKRRFMEKKNVYIPNNTLTLRCDLSYTSGIIQQESSRITAVESTEPNDHRLLKENHLKVPKCVLIDNMKSILNNSCLSDIKLRANGQTYPAHAVILGARSPVFKAMFSNDMKEKITDCVDIEDLSDQTVLRMLRYIYCAEVEELEWVSATELYEAADKYQILTLKDICSFYLKGSLCPSNACEALVLSDMHQDQDLKAFVQDFILRHGKDVINSEDWKQLMETHPKITGETMRLKFKE